MAQHIGQSAGEHAHLAMECRHPSERLGMIHRGGIFLFDELHAVSSAHHIGQRSERCERCGQDHRPGSWPPTAVRGGESLVQVDVHRVDAKITRADLTYNRVEVCAIAIDVATSGVDRIRNRLKIAFEQSAGVGIGDHHSGHIRAEPGGQRRQINPSFGGRGDVFNAEPGERSGGWVGPMRTFRHQHHCPIFAARLQCRLDAQHPAQFTMCAGFRGHRHPVHSGQRNQPMR